MGPPQPVFLGLLVVTTALFVVVASATDVSGFHQWRRRFAPTGTSSTKLSSAELRARYDRSAAEAERLNVEAHGRAKFAPGVFAHMTPDEWSARPRGILTSAASLRDIPGLTPMTFAAAAIAAAAQRGTIDWHEGVNRLGMHAVTRVRNQGACGSCYTFAVIGALEGAWRIAGHNLTAFSEQYLLDCVSSPYLLGCGGGSTQILAGLIAANGLRVPMDRDYEYIAYNGDTEACRSDVAGVGSATNAYQIVGGAGGSSEDSMLAFLDQYGPMVVAVKSSGPEWQHYAGGILNCSAPTASNELDHGVVVVGALVLDGVPVWKVKNSWTPLWNPTGDGYFYLPRGVNSCGVGFTPLGFVAPAP